MKKQVMETFTRAEKVKKLAPTQLFEDVYAELPKALQDQRSQLEEHLAEYGDKYPLEQFENV